MNADDDQRGVDRSLPMRLVQDCHFVQKVYVAGKQLHVRCKLCPSHMSSVVAGRQLEFAYYFASLVVKVASDRFHPSVIGVSSFPRTAA